MSYKPPTKSKYGDEIIDDSWSTSPNSIQSNHGSQSTISSTDQLPRESPQFNSPPTAPTNPSIPNLTPEDLLFLRGWQRDAFFYRVVPLCLFGLGSLFLYNKKKNLPHTITRYSLVVIGSYTLGKMSYAEELKRRIMASRSNTPFMQATRKVLKLPPITDSDYSAGYGTEFSQEAAFSGGWNSPADTRPSAYADRSSLDYVNQAPFDSRPEEPKQPLTYEELRSRNRNVSR